MDLFDYMRQTNQEKEAPLAARLRPRTLDEVVGQQHIIGKDKLFVPCDSGGQAVLHHFLRTARNGQNDSCEGDREYDAARSLCRSMRLWQAKRIWKRLCAKAKDNRGMFGKKTILFIDEIHRFNKSQQDYLLPFVEDGTLILIGATTENPYFEVNGALLSRSVIFELKPLSKEDIEELIRTGSL